MKILFLYQDITSGSKIATEQTVLAYQTLFPNDRLIIHKQQLPRGKGLLVFIGNFLWSILDYKRVISALDNIDVIYSTQYTYSFARLLSNKRRVPTVFHVHGDQALGKHQTTKNVVRRIYHKLIGSLVYETQKHALLTSTKVCFVSEKVKREFHNKYPFFSLKKCLVVPNGVDRKRFFPVSPMQKRLLKKKYKIPWKKVLVYVGRMDEKKGVHHIIHALSKLPSFGLIIVSPGTNDVYEKSYQNSLKKLAAQKASGNVLFLHDPKTTAEAYQFADCLILPSFQEMQSLVILEAISCGTLPITYDTGSIGSLVEPTRTYSLLKNISSSSIAEAVRRYDRLPENTKKTIRKLLINHSKKFTWEKSARSLYQAFRMIN
jgi:glycosyltransferase involved in cell wall biosynthesis